VKNAAPAEGTASLLTSGVQLHQGPRPLTTASMKEFRGMWAECSNTLRDFTFMARGQAFVNDADRFHQRKHCTEKIFF
jgi:hypothetical protein